MSEAHAEPKKSLWVIAGGIIAIAIAAYLAITLVFPGIGAGFGDMALNFTSRVAASAQNMQTKPQQVLFMMGIGIGGFFLSVLGAIILLAKWAKG
jgi:uncharacterized protein involved in exopolysaccharide biosynthesis